MAFSKLGINKSFFKDYYSTFQESYHVKAKRFSSSTVIKFFGRNTVNVDLSLHMNIHPFIHFLHTIPYDEKSEPIEQVVVDKSAPVPTLEGLKRVIDKILSYWNRRKRFHFLTLMKGDNHHRQYVNPQKILWTTMEPLEMFGELLFKSMK